MALEQIVYILSDTGTVCSVLTNALPEGKQEVCGILVLEQQIYLINDDICADAFFTVAGYTVKNAVEHNEHTDGKKLLAEVENVIAQQAVP